MRQDGKQSRSVDVGFQLLVIAVLVAAVFSLRPLATDSGVGPATIPPGEPDAALVVGRSQSGGFSLLGFEFGDATRTVSVQVSIENRCFERVALGDPWPAPFAECEAPVAHAGTVSGGGTLPTGESLVVVDIAVGEDCYDSTSYGDPWPPAETCP